MHQRRHGTSVSILVAQLCPTLCKATDCSPRGSSARGILQARTPSGLPFPSPGDLLDNKKNNLPKLPHKKETPRDF